LSIADLTQLISRSVVSLAGGSQSARYAPRRAWRYRCRRGFQRFEQEFEILDAVAARQRGTFPRVAQLPGSARNGTAKGPGGQQDGREAIAVSIRIRQVMNVRAAAHTGKRVSAVKDV